MSQITRLVPASGPGSGTVTSVSGGNNITITGNPAVNPTVNVSGTTNHAVQVGNASGSLTSIAVGTTGQVLTGVTGSDPVFAAPAASVISITGNTGAAQTGAIHLVTANSTPIFAGSAGTITLDFRGTENLLLGAPGAITSGSENCGYGPGAARAIASGDDNCFIGWGCAPQYTTGDESTAVGSQALTSAVAGASFNTAIGFQTLNQLAGAGTHNTCLGWASGNNYLTTESNNILVNNLGTVAESGVIRIGTNGTQTKAFVAGIAGVNVGSVATVVTEAGDQLGTAAITAGTGITVTPGANTITIASTITSGIQTITGNSGGALSGSNITFTGGSTGLTFGGAGTTETLAGTLAIANGGTNATSMATTDGVVYYDGTRLVTTSAGTAGQLLTSNGAGVAPTYQDGTGFLISTTVVTSAQVKALHATPIQLIAAPGVGNVIWIQNVITKMTYGGSNVFVAGASQFLAIFYGSLSGVRIYNCVGNSTITAASSGYTTLNATTTNTGVSTSYENTALVIGNNNATEISGNAANDNTVTVEIIYKIVTL